MTDSTKTSLVDLMDESQLRAEVRRLSRALTEIDKTRDQRGSLEPGWMVGGADVCATCCAHVVCMTEDENEIGRLRSEVEQADIRAGQFQMQAAALAQLTIDVGARMNSEGCAVVQLRDGNLSVIAS